MRNKTNKISNSIIIIISVILFFVFIYQLISGLAFKHYIMSFFIGLSLVVVGYLNNKTNNDKHSDK